MTLLLRLLTLVGAVLALTLLPPAPLLLLLSKPVLLPMTFVTLLCATFVWFRHLMIYMYNLNTTHLAYCPLKLQRQQLLLLFELQATVILLALIQCQMSQCTY
jgi:hypothetical protein